MEKRVLAVLVLASVTGVVLSADIQCAATCPGYKSCTALKSTNQTQFLNNSLSCNSENDALLGKLFNNMSSCAMMEASIDVADLLDVGWDGVGALEAIISDPEFWLEGCEWEELAAAACIYYSLPDGDTCNNTDNAVTRQNLFCPKMCSQMAEKCFNFKKYRHLKESVDTFCDNASLPADSNSTTCYKGQVDQAGLGAPVCETAKVVSLTGPYILAAIGLALAVVALIGLALITCRSGSGVGAPNSF